MEFLNETQLRQLSVDELVALNQDAGRQIDALRQYRALINQVRSGKQTAETIRHTFGDSLTDEQVEQINAVIQVKPLKMTGEVKDAPL